ncbi:FAD/NAD(P)-binding domain-containing protein [Earliella scabrosa]|nr:FAD/NAD(P)-binding domain-containing protein [Earliella scabrosa]
MSSLPTSQPHIAIIGGGPAGLVLLLTLHRRGIPATLYEREASFSSRSHLGGTLDLGYLSGQCALRENGLEDSYKKYSRLEGQEFRICDKDGNLLLHAPGEQVDPLDVRPEIDRSDLRRILLDTVPAESVKWGHGLSSVRPLSNGQHELTFMNGATVVSDILIGADGANSRVRPLVSPATLQYYGFTGSEISISPEVAARPDMQDIVEAVGNGSVFVPHFGKLFAFQRNSDGRIRAYAWHAAPEDWMTPSDPNEARRVLLEIYQGWAPWMLKFIANCDDRAIYHRPLYHLPANHRWDHVPGVTLVGDAAHVMGPNGAGANLAMLDGLELGVVLADAISQGKPVEEREAAIAAWESKMFESAGKIADETVEQFQHMANIESAAEFVKMMESVMDPSERRTK